MQPYDQEGTWFNVDENDESLTPETCEAFWCVVSDGFGTDGFGHAELDAFLWEMRNVVETHRAFDL